MNNSLSTNSTTGFTSLLYRSGIIYDWAAQRLVNQKKKFKSIATIIQSKDCKTVMDLPCGTGFLTTCLTTILASGRNNYSL